MRADAVGHAHAAGGCYAAGFCRPRNASGRCWRRVNGFAAFNTAAKSSENQANRGPHPDPSTRQESARVQKNRAPILWPKLHYTPQRGQRAVRRASAVDKFNAGYLPYLLVHSVSVTAQRNDHMVQLC
jgi:hypothetical protein